MQAWKASKVTWRLTLMEAKFSQNRKLREMLLATGDEDLLHESGKDQFWGRDQKGTGQNRLGIMLVEVRASLGG
ncbi:MAG: NADAR domain-containing protein [Verrucomicrobiales bacterium]